ncbi:MAG: FAD-dependent oxidoreductase [Simkaniaceae bacterium]|nr:FAD-dependent oxidoreductase [Simkaniaceae bacterium]
MRGPRVAVIGAGLSGLGATHHLLRVGCEVTLFEQEGVGKGTSAVATGLVHPCRGMPFADAGMRETKVLLQEAASALGRSPVISGGIVRLAMEGKREQTLLRTILQRADCRPVEGGGCFPGFSGARIGSGLTIDVPLYLQGLFLSSLGSGLRFTNRRVCPLSLSPDFDQVVMATGGDVLRSERTRPLLRNTLSENKGQVLLCASPSPFRLPESVIGKGYVAVTSDPDRFIFGATYEKTFPDRSPCIRKAKEVIFSKVGRFFPGCTLFSVLDCLAGIRVHRRRVRLPLIGRLRKNVWIITAMGSFGLLYHAFTGKTLAIAIKEGREEEIPEALRLCR